jgi:hypothetical protein
MGIANRERYRELAELSHLAQPVMNPAKWPKIAGFCIRASPKPEIGTGNPFSHIREPVMRISFFTVHVGCALVLILYYHCYAIVLFIRLGAGLL